MCQLCCRSAKKGRDSWLPESKARAGKDRKYYLEFAHAGRILSLEGQGVETHLAVMKETVMQTVFPDMLLPGSLEMFWEPDFLELFPGWRLQGVQTEAMGRH